MKNGTKVGIGFAAAVTLVITGTAFAGARLTPDVTVNLAAKTASGAFGTARRVPGSQFITCDADTPVAPPGFFATPVVRCSATASNGNHAECVYSNDGAAVGVIGKMNPDSYIVFKWDVAGGVSVCTFLQVINSSEYEPKR